MQTGKSEVHSGVEEEEELDSPPKPQKNKAGFPKLHNKNVIRQEGSRSSNHECLLSIITRGNYLFSF
jgi:hypothetical protein